MGIRGSSREFLDKRLRALRADDLVRRYPRSIRGARHRGFSIRHPLVPGLALTVHRDMALTADPNLHVTFTANTETAHRLGSASSSWARPEQHIPVRHPLQLRGDATAAPRPSAGGRPAPAPARSYLVFFDWDKATLTERPPDHQRCRRQLDRVQYTRIEVDGYSDTSGTPKYNEGLSVSRARAVARNSPRMACRKVRSTFKVSATHICWCRLVRACVSRKIDVSKSSYASAST